MNTINNRLVKNIKSLSVKDTEQLYESIYNDLKDLSQIIVKKHYSGKVFTDYILDVLGHTVATDIIMKLKNGKCVDIENWYYYLYFFIKIYLPYSSSSYKYSPLFKQEPNLIDNLDISDFEDIFVAPITTQPDYNIRRKEMLQVFVLDLKKSVDDKLQIDDKKLISYFLILNICLIFTESNLNCLPIIGKTAEIIRLFLDEDLKIISKHGISKWI